MFRNDTDLAKAIKAQKSEAFRFLYQAFFRQVEHLVLRNGGSENEAHQLFEDATVVLWEYLSDSAQQHDGDLRISEIFLGISHQLWANRHLEEDQRLQALELENLSAQGAQNRISEASGIRAMSTLDGQCQQLLTMYYIEDRNPSEIASQLGIRESDFPLEKWRCMQQFKRAIDRQNQSTAHA